MSGMPHGSAVIQLLFDDPQFRAAFRRDAAAACRARGLRWDSRETDVPDLQRLEGRESRSGLGGAVLAAAADGVEIAQRAEPVELAPHTGRWQTAEPVGAASAGSLQYPGDGAPKERIAAWMGDRAARHGLPRELPVMAALVESELRNLPDGDAASVGYFQMQTTVWLERYPGYPDDPGLQMRWFIDQALAVREKHPELARDPALWGEWVAHIERPHESLRYKYAERLEEARALVRDAARPTEPAGSGTGSVQAAEQPSAARTGAGAVVPTADADDARVLRLKAEAELIDDATVPYLWGGGHAAAQPHESPVTPLDCSGAVSRVLGIAPLVSEQFESWGAPGPGRRVTIYANDEHVLMEIDGHFWGTSRSNPGGGPGWIPRQLVSRAYLAGFTLRHPPGL